MVNAEVVSPGAVSTHGRSSGWHSLRQPRRYCSIDWGSKVWSLGSQWCQQQPQYRCRCAGKSVLLLTELRLVEVGVLVTLL